MNGKMFVLPRDKMKKLKYYTIRSQSFPCFVIRAEWLSEHWSSLFSTLPGLALILKKKNTMNERLSRFSCVTNELRKRPLLFMHTCPSYQSSFSSKPRCASKKLSIGHKIKCEVIILVKNSKKTTKTTTPTTTTAMSNTGQHERKPTSQRCECK